jgi:hypothetical protein
VTDVAKDADGTVIERTEDYFAQDKSGNVWYFGESVKNYDPDTGKFLDTDGSWLAGKNGAAPGIVMEANPKVGDSYNQENAPPVAVDHADVTSLKGTAKLDQFGNLNKLLVTLETNNNEPTTTENKYYAAGVGEVFSQVYESGVLEETEQLVSINGSTQLVQAMASFGANSSGSAAPLTTASSDQPAPLNLLSPPGHHA